MTSTPWAPDNSERLQAGRSRATEACLLASAAAIRRIFLLFGLIVLPIACSGSGSHDKQTSTLPERPYKVYDKLVDPMSMGPYVAAHRGAHSSFPENSLAAIREAARLGADFAEIDIRPTQDDVLVVMHDASLLRTTGCNADVSAMTYAQIRALTLLGSDASNPETLRVPTYVQAAALAREMGIMLYVDVKTSRDDLVVADTQAGPYYDVSLLRSSYEQALRLQALDPKLLLMPAVPSIPRLNAVIETMPGVKIVELDQRTSDAAFCAAARAAGVKVQQDVLALSDVAATLGDYGGWGNVAETGVWLMQTNKPEWLIPAARTYRLTGTFP